LALVSAPPGGLSVDLKLIHPPISRANLLLTNKPRPLPSPRWVYHVPVFSIDAHGSCFGFGPPFCNSSIEMLSGDRMKAM